MTSAPARFEGSHDFKRSGALIEEPFSTALLTIAYSPLT